MDPYRRRIAGILEERFGKPLNMKEVSGLLGKNVAYVHQFLNRGTPRILGEETRAKLAELTGKPADTFKPQPGELDRRPEATKPPVINPLGVDASRPATVALPKLQAGEPGPRDLPVRATEVSGKSMDFTFRGSISRLIERPELLRGVEGAYAVYVVGDAVAPAAYNGQLAYADPSVPPVQQRLVVVEMRDGSGMVREFVSADADWLVVKEYRPEERELRLPRGAVKSFDRVRLVGDA